LIFTPDHFTLENSRVPIEWEAGLNSDDLKKETSAPIRNQNTTPRSTNP